MRRGQAGFRGSGSWVTRWRSANCLGPIQEAKGTIMPTMAAIAHLTIIIRLAKRGEQVLVGGMPTTAWVQHDSSVDRQREQAGGARGRGAGHITAKAAEASFRPSQPVTSGSPASMMAPGRPGLDNEREHDEGAAIWEERDDLRSGTTSRPPVFLSTRCREWAGASAAVR